MEESSSSDKKKKLSMLQLTMMIWAVTCSGPFGIEEAVESGGILYTLIGLMIVPIIYSVPQSLMCSELGSMMPSYHGYIIWVYRAFGDIAYIGEFIGFYNAICELISMASDIPIYPILMSFYFEQLISTYFNDFKFTFWTGYLFKLFMIVIGGIFGIFNITTLGNSAILFSFIILLPFIIGFIYSIPNTNISTWTNSTPYNDNKEYQWGLFLTTMLWCSTGWDSIGSFMAELNFPKSRIFISFLAGMILVYLAYTIPILGALTVECDTDCWDDGYLYTAYDTIIPHLGILVVIAGFLCGFSLYISELAVQARHFWALSQPTVIMLANGKMYTEGHDNIYYDDEMNEIKDTFFNEIQQQIDIKRIEIGIFPQWLCGTVWDRTGAPVRGVLLQSLISSGLILFDFQTLLQGMTLITAITWMLEFLSFIILRYIEPNTHRPFKIPGGLFIAWLITIDKLILIIGLLVLIMYQTPEYLYLFSAINVFVVIWYALYRHHKNKQKNRLINPTVHASPFYTLKNT